MPTSEICIEEEGSPLIAKRNVGAHVRYRDFRYRLELSFGRALFRRIDNSAYILGKEQHSARRSWIYIDGETFNGARADIAGDPKEPWINIAWKYLYTAKDSWLGSEANLGAIGAAYNLTMDPYEKYDMTFNGAAPARVLTTSPGGMRDRTTAGWRRCSILSRSSSTRRS